MGIQKEVSDDEVLWRYMDLSKLLDILVHNQLTFPRTDLFEDNYEGHPNKYLDYMKQSYMDNLFLGLFGKLKGCIATGAIRNNIKISNLSSYISCWHMNKCESAGMWRLYCSSSDSVAIKTTVGKLNEALDPNSNNLIKGKVLYDFEPDKRPTVSKIEFLDSLFIKRPSFEHEREYRIIYNDSKIFYEYRHRMMRDFEKYHNSEISAGNYEKLTPELEQYLESGIYFDTKKKRDMQEFILNDLRSGPKKVHHIKVNPSQFIDEIVISPDSPDWFVNTVKLTIKKLGYDFPLHKSKLYELN